MISPRARIAVIASAGASGTIEEPLILDGITGAISEWDGENSTKTGNPITQWDDLITTNHFTEDHTTGNGAVPSTINGRAALDFTPAQHYDGGAIEMPAPSTGFTICVVLRPHDVTVSRVVVGREGIVSTGAGFSLQVHSAPSYRAGLSNGTTLVARNGSTGAAVANTTAIVQGGYSSSVVKLKINGGSPLTAAHTITTLGAGTSFGLGSRAPNAATTNAFDGDILWVGCCTGLLSDADMATIATRLNTRFEVF